jgi:hypothetical protein
MSPVLSMLSQQWLATDSQRYGCTMHPLRPAFIALRAMRVNSTAGCTVYLTGARPVPVELQRNFIYFCCFT